MAADVLAVEPVVFKAGLIAVWLLLFLCLERVRPASPWKAADSVSGFSQPRHIVQNLTLWLVNLIVPPAVTVAVTLWAVDWGQLCCQSWWSLERWHASGNMAAPGWWSVVVALFHLLVLDLWIYWWHRANHQVPLLWRFHRVHHLDQQLDTTSALRFHFGEVLLSAFARAPVIIVFAIPFTTVIIFEALVTCAAIFHHSNLKLPATGERRLSRWLITPAIHWVHHHAVRRDTDSNYGTLLSGWDRLFSSLSATVRRTDMALGVEGEVENRPLRLLLVPFSGPGSRG